MMKLLRSLFLPMAVSAVSLRSEPNFRLGQSLGNLISKAASGEDKTQLQEAMNNVMNAIPAPHSAAVDSVINAANAKAEQEQAAASFLQKKAINLHIEETPNTLSAARAESESNLRQELLTLEQNEAKMKESLANAITAHRQTSFAQNPLEAGIVDVQRQTKQFQALTSLIDSYSAAVKAKGYSARKALIGLTNLVAEPDFKAAAVVNLKSGLMKALKEYMEDESTPDQMRTAAGSILTRITGLPVAVSSADVNSGSYGHVNIVLPSPSRVYQPDEVVTAVKAGASRRDYYG